MLLNVNRALKCCRSCSTVAQILDHTPVHLNHSLVYISVFTLVYVLIILDV